MSRRAVFSKLCVFLVYDLCPPSLCALYETITLEKKAQVNNASNRPLMLPAFASPPLDGNRAVLDKTAQPFPRIAAFLLLYA